MWLTRSFLCTAALVSLLRDQPACSSRVRFISRHRHSVNGARGRTRISCPTARWRDVLASKLFGAANFLPHAAVLFNVRSNKGYAIALNAAALWAAERKCGCLEIIMRLFGDYEALRMEIIPVVPEDHFGRALGSSCGFGRYWM